jgi:hypothetical protein
MMKKWAVIAATLMTVALAGYGEESAPSKPQPPTYDASKYAGGDGLTREHAVVILTTSEMAGVRSEYTWMREHYPGAKRTMQAVTVPQDGKRFDVLTIETVDGRSFDLWFDITAFWPVGAK